MHRNLADALPHRSLWRIPIALLLGAALLAGCGEEPEVELEGRFGPGVAPPAVVGTIAPIDLTKSSGGIVGMAEYDSDYWFDQGTTSSSEFENLTDTVDPLDATVAVTLSRITGRPDTPCRFQAAVLARDEDYEILESGERENARSIDFYQVNLKDGGIYLSLFCAELKDEVGVAVQVVTGSKALITSQQVHYILNSIRKS